MDLSKERVECDVRSSALCKHCVDEKQENQDEKGREHDRESYYAYL
jgi:hypothetical protein